MHFWDYTTPTAELLRALDDVVRMGKVHYIAIADTPSWEVARANTMAELKGWSYFIAYQGRYHLLERDVEWEIGPMCEKMNIGFIPWGVLGQGRFTTRYLLNRHHFQFENEFIYFLCLVLFCFVLFCFVSCMFLF